jgi:hypothetical protein
MEQVVLYFGAPPQKKKQAKALRFYLSAPSDKSSTCCYNLARRRGKRGKSPMLYLSAPSDK